MGIVQISGGSSGIITDRHQFSVEIKGRWGDSWRVVNYLRPLTASVSISPSIPVATFLYTYGDIKREDSNVFNWVSPIDIANNYVRILSHGSNGQQVLFVGILTDDHFEVHGATTDPQGNQTITAYGLEHLLDRTAVYGALTDNGWIDWMPTFNDRDQWGGLLQGNRSTANGWNSAFSTDGEEWTYLDIILYMLQNHSPSGLNIGISGAYDVLDSLKGRFNFDGLTLRQVLDKLIDRRRGLGWMVWSNGGDVNIYIFSVFDEGVSVGGVYYPGNPEQIDLALDDLIDIESAEIGVNQSQLYDTIVVQGQRVKTCFSASFADGTLQAAWSGSEETSYKNIIAADGKTGDILRSADDYTAVYQRFIVPDSWNWFAGNGIGGYGGNAVPSFDNFAYPDYSTPGPYSGRPRPLLRALPLTRVDGIDYDNYLPPVAIIKHTDDQGADAYYPIDQLDKIKKSPASLRMLDGDMGLEIRGKINHSFGKNSFDSATNGPTEHEPDFDYNDLICTVAVESDVRPKVIVELGGETEVNRTLVINVYDAEFWYITPGTVEGVSDGQVVHHSGGVTRDDTEKLRNIAAMAAAWYGKYRGTVRLTVKDVVTSMLPGALIVSASSSWQNEPVSTVISRVTYDFTGAKTTIETGFAELDFSVLLDIPGMSDFRSVGRAFNRQQAEIGELKKHLNNLPVRNAAAGSGSESGGVPVLIKSKQSGSVYLVDVYGNGSAEDPTEEGVECEQLQIDTAETIPASTWAIATKINGSYYMQVPVWL